MVPAAAVVVAVAAEEEAEAVAVAVVVAAEGAFRPLRLAATATKVLQVLWAAVSVPSRVRSAVALVALVEESAELAAAPVRGLARGRS